MRVLPILFNTEMVRAIKSGRKTVTRRVVKRDMVDAVLSSPARMENPDISDDKFIKRLCTAPCEPGDILYVRETWDNKPITPGGHFRPNGVWYYKADGDLRPESWRGNWHPSIHMPKEAARLFLRVTDVRVERLQDITEEGKTAEGMCPGWQHYNFYELWDSTIKPADRDRYGWAANPWVWVIEFERASKEAVLKGGDEG